MEKIILFTGVILCTLLSSCASIPQGVQVVRDFEADKYLGKWYEIARLDHSFERGLSNVTATYSNREDGGIDVMNKGYNLESQKWQEAKGRAYFVEEKNVASLKVTFFWPFYGGYNVMELDRKNYSYAMVCGPNRSYLWILSRTKTMEPDLLDRLMEMARKLDFDVDDLIIVQHDLSDR
ncbi:lipocalin family protein [Candidatus Uabimicrobium amorphum]|uniref:Outer membrane lipoprotein Blc n=1 Tax=Uabimicrobium amorphum TaxID=2596890 RepID=A0A5S9F3W7_UABAM|nr:lipocalin family protein [Candidatus Uabimicrobium amorphum]BBM84573.1 outer membrane lipoprotein Blc [Candidatus Uabimicrobium amorphum]